MISVIVILLPYNLNAASVPVYQALSVARPIGSRVPSHQGSSPGSAASAEAVLQFVPSLQVDTFPLVDAALSLTPCQPSHPSPPWQRSDPSPPSISHVIYRPRLIFQYLPLTQNRVQLTRSPALSPPLYWQLSFTGAISLNSCEVDSPPSAVSPYHLSSWVMP